VTIAISCWQPPPPSLQLTTGQIDLWRYRLDAAVNSISKLQGLLPADESARAEKLKIPVKQRQFVAARAGLRSILAQYLSQQPHELQFAYGREGKPALAESRTSLDFNLSHSGAWALLAVTRSGAVGVDVEQIEEEIDFQQITENYFDRQELACLAAATERRRRRIFYRLWTCKESWSKMRGTGLSASLKFKQRPSSARPVYVAPDVVAALSADFEITSINKFQPSEI